MTLLCEHFGGKLVEIKLDATDFLNENDIRISLDDQSPEDGGLWRKFKRFPSDIELTLTTKQLMDLLVEIFHDEVIDDSNQYRDYITSLSNILCEHFGGAVLNITEDCSAIFIIPNENSPANGGIWPTHAIQGAPTQFSIGQ
jgi:hypothetical protein